MIIYTIVCMYIVTDVGRCCNPGICFSTPSFWKKSKLKKVKKYKKYYLYTLPSIDQSISQSIHTSIHPSIHTSTHASTHSHIHSSTHQSNPPIHPRSSMEQLLLEKAIIAQSLRKFPIFYGTRKFCAVFTKARH